MFSLTSARAIYTTLFFTTTLTLGGAMANRGLLTATGLVGSYAGTLALLNRDKELPDSVSLENKKRYARLKLDFDQLKNDFQSLNVSTQKSDSEIKQDLDSLLEVFNVQSTLVDSISKGREENYELRTRELETNLDNQINQLQEVLQALQISTQKENLKLQQDLDLLLEKVTVRLEEVDSESNNSQGDLNQNYNELELDLNNRLQQLQEAFQSLQLLTQEGDFKLQQDLDLLLERVDVQSVTVDSISHDSQGNLEQKYSELRYELNRLLTRVNHQHCKTQRWVLPNYIKLKDRISKLESTISQNTATLTLQPELNSVASLSRPLKTLVFIDQANLHHACKTIDIKLDYAALKRWLTPEIGECELRIYLGVDTSFRNKKRELKPSEKQERLNRELESLGYQTTQLPIFRYANGSEKIVGDDIKLSCDLLTMAQNGEICDRDRVILISGDADFQPPLQQMKEIGIDVELIAHKPSRHLKPWVDRITHINDIKHKICK